MTADRTGAAGAAGEDVERQGHAPWPTRAPRGLAMAQRAVPAVLFLALLAWGWRVWDLAHGIPYYEDVLEVIWTVSWYDGALRGLHDAQVYSLAYFPVGWQVATFGEGPAMFLLLLPLNWVGGAAFAHNVVLLLSFGVAFIGARQLALRWVGPGPATIAALLFTFWGFRWYGIVGHLNIMLASALLPWLVLALERAQEGARRSVWWLVLAGLLWAITIASSWYFVWMGGILLVGWMAGRYCGKQVGTRAALLSIGVPALVAAVLVAPLLIWFIKASAAAGASYFSLSEVSAWDASLNSFAAPSVAHPWLQPLAHLIYRGPVNEPGQTNFGLVAFVLAVAGLRWAWRDRRWLPVLIVTGAGLLLALGLTLKWNGETIQWAALRPLNGAIWHLGHWLKPGLFPTTEPPAPFDAAVPLPALLLSAMVPFWERARVFARYALVASTGLFLLSALALTRVKWPWARALLAALLVLEVIPPPTANLPYPLRPHPAFAWLAQQPLAPGESTIDLGSWQPSLTYIPIGGSVLWETQFHGKPTIAGASSVWPAHVVFLNEWLAAHPNAFKEADFVPILRYYGVRYAVLHVSGGYARDMLDEARQNPELDDWHCFDPAPGDSPWNYPICVATVSPGPASSNVLFRSGWSAAEGWGRWGEGTEAKADWVAIARASQQLAIEAIPVCAAGRAQRVVLEVNGRELATHRWSGCESWRAQIAIPAEWVQIGWNQVVIRSDFAARPVEITHGANPDTRPLSVGVSTLRVQ